MLKRLFGGNEYERLFEECQVNKTHQMMYPKRILDLACKYFSQPISEKNNVNINININSNLDNHINININSIPHNSTHNQKSHQKKEELIALILRKIRSSSDVLRIKGLVLAHGIIKKTYDQEFMDVIGEQVERYMVGASGKWEGEVEVKGQSMQREFIHKHIISFYCQYLKKFIMDIDTYRYAQNYLNGGKAEEKQGFIEMVSQGFVVLNLCNYILQSQFTFNKMGRYYLEYNEIVNLFLMYLSDLVVYNSFIKELSRISLKNFKEATPEQIRHHFLFVTESQKTSDRLYEFFYNRYYYSQVKKLILMPTFLTIHADQYNQLANYVKKNDPDLAQIVKNSKFATRSGSHPKKNLTSMTDLNEFTLHDLTELTTKLNQTEVMQKKPDFFHFMNYVEQGHQDLEDLTVATVKKFTVPKS